jgi:fatty acid-binding protein DegV
MAVAATAGRAVDVAVHHLGAQSQAEAVVARLRSVLTGLGEVSNTEVGAVVGTHVGPGAIAVVIAPRV